MSVIIHDEIQNKFIVYSKGADNVMLNLLDKEENKHYHLNFLKNGLEEYSTEGLRTLLLAYKEISLDEYN